MMTQTETKRIRTEGRHAPLRPKARLVIEVEHEIALMVEGRYLGAKPIQGGGGCEHTTSRVEIYEDRLQHIMDTQWRTPKHLEAWAQAEKMCAFNVEEWQREHSSLFKGKTSDERDAITKEHCLLWPGMYLQGFGYRTGIPSLLSVKVVSQRDADKTVDALDFLTKTEDGTWLMSHDERAEFIGTAPPTEHNALDRTGTMIANALERAMAINASNTKTRR